MEASKEAWLAPQPLGEHTKLKHEIIQSYFGKYLGARIFGPRDRPFCLAIIDGFCGGANYDSGPASGSLAALAGLNTGIKNLNINRMLDGLDPIEVSVDLFLNDSSAMAVEHHSSLVRELHSLDSFLKLEITTTNDEFRNIWPKLAKAIGGHRFDGVIVLSDPFGWTQITVEELRMILGSHSHMEIIHTLMFQVVRNYISQIHVEQRNKLLKPFGFDEVTLRDFEVERSSNEFRGMLERAIFNAHRYVGEFHTPFLNKNPTGRDYALLHFARHYRAREVFNDVLHDHSNAMIHVGRGGLKMLSIERREDLVPYFFSDVDRQKERELLTEDLSRVVSENSGAISVNEFYREVYNNTPASSSEIRAAMINSPDLEVITEQNRARRSASQISAKDVLRLKSQRSLF